MLFNVDFGCSPSSAWSFIFFCDGSAGSAAVRLMNSEVASCLMNSQSCKLDMETASSKRARRVRDEKRKDVGLGLRGDLLIVFL